MERLALRALARSGSRHVQVMPLLATAAETPQRTTKRKRHHLPSCSTSRPSLQRDFSSTSTSSAPMKTTPGGQPRKTPMRSPNKAPPTPSLQRKAQMLKVSKDGEVFARELGILPETFVTCRLSERPSLTKDPLGRWRWEVARIKWQGQTCLALAFVKFVSVRTKSPEQIAALSRWQRYRYRLFEWFDLELFKVRKIAMGLYGDMYVALAEGKLEAMRPRLQDGIYARLSDRVTMRGRNAYAHWELLKWNRQPRLRSLSITLLTNDVKAWKQSMIQQAVVEFDSVQSLKNYRVVPKRGRNGQPERAEDGTVLTETVEEGEPPKPRSVREFMVVQRSMIEGVISPWMIWGMTRATTLSDVRNQHLRRLGLDQEPSA